MPRFSITEEWVRGQEFSQTLQDVLKMMQNFMGNKNFSFSVATNEDFVVIHSLNGNVTVPLGYKYKQVDSLFMQSFNKDKELATIQDVENEFLVQPHGDLFKVRSYLGIPLMIQNELMGVLSVTSSEEWEIQATDIQAVRTVAKLIVEAIELYNYSVVDKLTGLYNKSQIKKVLRLHENDTFSVIVFDIDDFKQVNDEVGHTIGDQVLSSVGDIVLNSIPEDSFGFRFGGDEFCILLPFNENLTPEEVVENIQENILKRDGYACSISAGIATSKTTTSDNIIECADKALYEAKRKGKNQWATWCPKQIFPVQNSM